MLVGAFICTALATLSSLVSASPVVGGKTLKNQNKYEFMMAIVNDDNFECGGSLIGKNLMITAAHCSTGVKLSKLRVLANRLNLKKTNAQEAGVVMTVKKIHIHPKYKDEPTPVNDIAIWELAGGDNWNHYIDLPTSPVVPTLVKGKVVGWGTTSENGELSPILKEITMPIVPVNQCSKMLDVKLPQSNFCASGKQSKDSCQGDSGGPFIIRGADGKPTLLGVVSFGYGCGEQGMPGVYARVWSYLNFINAIKKQHDLTASTTATNDINDPLANKPQNMAGVSAKSSGATKKGKGKGKKSGKKSAGSSKKRSTAAIKPKSGKSKGGLKSSGKGKSKGASKKSGKGSKKSKATKSAGGAKGKSNFKGNKGKSNRSAKASKPKTSKSGKGKSNTGKFNAVCEKLGNGKIRCRKGNSKTFKMSRKL